jgi:acyl-CoA synthetase (AMP-forming)/AMP-acid ligase II
MRILLSRLKGVHQVRRTLTGRALQDRLDHHAGVSGERVAIFDETSSWTYSRLATGSGRVARALADEGVAEENVAFLCGNDASYAVSQFGIWKSGNACVPLFKSHPTKSLGYYVDDSRSRVIIASKSYADKVVKGSHRKVSFVSQATEGFKISGVSARQR